jgi:hypothetical protein
LPALYQILQQYNKNGEKINKQFYCGNLEKVRFGYRYLNSYKLSVVFKPNKVLTSQKIFGLISYCAGGINNTTRQRDG